MAGFARNLTSTTRPSQPRLRPSQLLEWTRSLPLASPVDAAGMVTEQLARVRVEPLSVRQQLDLLSVLQVVVDEMADALRQRLGDRTVPPSAHQERVSAALRALLGGAADAYFGLFELLGTRQRSAAERVLLAETIYYAVHFRADHLVQCYAIYRAPPAGAWSSLNRLYQFAERQHLQTIPLDVHALGTPLPFPRTIDWAYKRIAALAAAEPYRLMAGEAERVYRALEPWAQGCELMPIGGLSPQGEHVVDMDSDVGPRYVSGEREFDPRRGYVLDLSEVQAAAMRRLKQLLHDLFQRGDIEPPSLAERQERDMYVRLADAWRGTWARSQPRRAGRGEVELVVGLNNCHFLTEGRAVFAPEMAELRLRASAGNTAEPPDGEAFGAAYKRALARDRLQTSITPGAALRLPEFDRSDSGLAVGYEPRAEAGLRVGEMALWRRTTASSWQLGVVRWLELTSATGRAGLEQLADEALAVAAKAVRGVGAGTGYVRAFILVERLPGGVVHSLAVPCAAFDVGSVVLLNNTRQLRRVRLTRLLSATRSFSRFGFTLDSVRR